MGEKRSVQKVLVGKSEGARPFRNCRLSKVECMEMHLGGLWVGGRGMDLDGSG